MDQPRKPWADDFRSRLYRSLREQGRTQTEARAEAGVSRRHASRIDARFGYSTKAKDRSAPTEPERGAAEPAHQTIQQTAVDRALDTARQAALPPADDDAGLMVSVEGDPFDPVAHVDDVIVKRRDDRPAPTQTEVTQAMVDAAAVAGQVITIDEDLQIVDSNPTVDPDAHRYRGDDAVHLKVEPDGFPRAGQEVDPRFAPPGYVRSQDARMRGVRERRAERRDRYRTQP